jgi:2-methylisocitrate lyase-like PEP mutase family enzyme
MSDKARLFLELHHADEPLLLPNPWDAGSARVFASLGFQALATTSSGHAATLGRFDGGVGRDEALRHAAVIAGATDLPVNADLENCFGHAPAAVAETIMLAIGTGVAGVSVEDFSGDETDPIYDPVLARERVEAAAAAAGDEVVVTARCENYLHGRRDLDDTIARLQAYQEAGADVLYAPGLADADDIRRVVASVDLPVNVLALAQAPSVSELAALGVKRISVGGAFSLVGLAAIEAAAREFLEAGTYGFWEQAHRGIAVRSAAFDPPG